MCGGQQGVQRNCLSKTVRLNIGSGCCFRSKLLWNAREVVEHVSQDLFYAAGNGSYSTEVAAGHMQFATVRDATKAALANAACGCDRDATSEVPIELQGWI